MDETNWNEFNLIFANVVANWNTIRSHEKIIKSVNMNSNIVCKKIKIMDPHLTDHYIQSYVLSMMLFHYLLVCKNMINNTDKSNEISID